MGCDWWRRVIRECKIPRRLIMVVSRWSEISIGKCSEVESSREKRSEVEISIGK